MQASNKFLQFGGGGAFADKQKKLFEQLSIAEKECNKDRIKEYPPTAMEIDSPNLDAVNHPPRGSKRHRSEMRQFRGKESIFKRPDRPAPRANSRSIPDHHKNPHKWVKYTLDDVSGDDMSDHSNARTAFAFLKELKARRARERESDSTVEDGAIVPESLYSRVAKSSAGVEFRKPEVVSRGPLLVLEKEEKPTFRSSKVVMPEYVVGQKQKKKGRERKAAADRVIPVRELRLNHLTEFNDEDGERT